MADRVIDLNTLLPLVSSRSDYVRIIRSCLLNLESKNGQYNQDDDSVDLLPASEAASELHQLVFSQPSDVVKHFLHPHAIEKYPLEALRALLSLPCWCQTPW